MPPENFSDGKTPYWQYGDSSLLSHLVLFIYAFVQQSRATFVWEFV